MKKRPLSFFLVITLWALIIIRLFVDDANGWISFLNYFGLVIATWSFLIEFSAQSQKNKATDFIKGVLILVIAVLVVFGCLIVTGVIKLCILVNDEILLLTLLISLPTNYYCELLAKLVNKQPRKEHTYGTR